MAEVGNVPGSRPEKCYKDAGEMLQGFVAHLRAFFFYLWTCIVAIPLFTVMVIISPFVFLLDRYRRKGQHLVNLVWAKLSTFPFYRVKIEGKHQLLPNNRPAVYVANHQSYLDM